MVSEMFLYFFRIAFVYYPFVSISFFVSGLVLLALLVSRKAKLVLGITLFLFGVILLVSGLLFQVNNQSIPVIFAGLALLMTHVPRKNRLFLGASLLFSGIVLYALYGHHVLILSIPLGLAGLVLLATVAQGKRPDLRKPAGVTAIGVFALLGSTGLGYYVYLASALSGIGSFGFASAGTFGISTAALFMSSLTVFAFSGLVLSILVLRGVSSKYLWYAMMMYWISLLAFSFVRDVVSLDYYLRGFWLPSFLVFFLPTYIYPAICIVYFLTKKPRQYFHLGSKINSTYQTTI